MRKKRRIKTYFAYAVMGIGGIIIWAIVNRIVCWCDKGDKNNDL